MPQPTTTAPSTITCNDKPFQIYLDAPTIHARVTELGRQIAHDLPDNPLFVGILSGSFIFMADLVRAYGRPCAIDFMKISSYGSATTTSGHVTHQLDLQTDITGRHVIIVEDIIDTGLSMTRLTEQLRHRQPASLTLVTLLHKAEVTKYPLDIRYIGFTIPNKFVLGYGLDYAQQGRNLPHIYALAEN